MPPCVGGAQVAVSFAHARKCGCLAPCVVCLQLAPHGGKRAARVAKLPRW